MCKNLLLCKNPAFLQLNNGKKNLLFNKNIKAALLCKKAVFLTLTFKLPFYVKSSFFTRMNFRENKLATFTLPCKHFIVGLLNSLDNSLKALIIYFLFTIIISCFLWRSIFQLLTRRKEQAVVCFVMFIGRSHHGRLVRY